MYLSKAALQLNLADRVYGPLIELFDCDVEYITAVEVGAQVTRPCNLRARVAAERSGASTDYCSAYIALLLSVGCYVPLSAQSSAQGNLFHIVVDSDETAAKLIAKLAERKCALIHRSARAFSGS